MNSEKIKLMKINEINENNEMEKWFICIIKFTYSNKNFDYLNKKLKIINIINII